MYVELFHFPLMCMYKHWNSKVLLGKSQKSFDTGIVKVLRKFQYWAERKFLINKSCIGLEDGRTPAR